MTQAQPEILIETTSSEQTALLGTAIGRCALAGDVLTLEGELGAGKTQFARGLAEGMQIDPRQVSSPTFVMVQEYEPKAPPEASLPLLVHIDAYRIHSDDELESIGWFGEGEELREGAVVAVEWASLIERALPVDRLDVHIRHAPLGRAISLTPRGGWAARISGLLDVIAQAGFAVRV